MKETVKTSRTIGYLEKIFRNLNEHYFNNYIEEPIITVQSTPKAYGHVTVDKRWKRGQKGDFRHELNIGAGTLDRPIENVVSTMLHEMVHLYHLQKGIQDCSRGGTYHNKVFKEKAETVDLIITYDKRIGWSITEPSDNLILYIAEQGWDDIKMNRYEGWIPTSTGTKKPGGDGTKIVTPPTGKTSSTRKYQCMKCKMSVRATKDLTGKLKCTDCDEIMIEV